MINFWKTMKNGYSFQEIKLMIFLYNFMNFDEKNKGKFKG